MSKKQKIIVSITGIFLVMLILVGLTYAYFLTRIQGNTNTKSISVTTADLKIVYGDGNKNIITKEKIQPGDVIGEKDFTVTNEGNSESDYIVVIDGVSITNVTSGDTTTFNSNDFVYTLTCRQVNKNTGVETGTCESITSETTLPLTNNSILVSNSVPENIRHEYVLTVTYKETWENQSNDMNKKLEAKVDIKDIRTINPYSSGTLAYNIINNSVTKTNGTVLRAKPLTKPAEEISDYSTGNYDTKKISEIVDMSWGGPTLFIDDTEEADNPTEVQYNNCTNSDIGKYLFQEGWGYELIGQVSGCINGEYGIIKEEIVSEKTLSVTNDDLGISYYFRGNPIDNYVNFANKCWRIVRIEGDGSVKLILEDQDSTCASSNGNWDIPTTPGGSTLAGNFGYDNSTYSGNIIASYLNPVTNVDSSQIYAFYNFQNSLSSANKNKLKAGNWCYDDKAYTNENGGSVITDKSSYYTNNTTFYYDSYVRLYGGYDITVIKPTLKCQGIVLNSFNNVTYNNNVIIMTDDMYVGTLTADEIVYAGGKAFSSNEKYYLINDYQKDEHLFWWSLSPGYFFDTFGDSTMGVNDGGRVVLNYVYVDYSFRPAVSLKSGTTISGGDGTKGDAYTIN